MSIPFSPPFINNAVKEEVLDSLESGWITTGPKVNQLEKEIAEFAGCEQVVCVNSWTSGAIMMLKWLGLKPGDEVIVPAYTYAATALSVIHAGGTPVIVDVDEDFNMSLQALEKAFTPRTKAVMPVDVGGWPCDYDAINEMVRVKKHLFRAEGEVQQKLGRVLVISDAAHSIGSFYKGRPAGSLTDITIFSLHAVKNVTTAEGGAICLNFNGEFDNAELYKLLRCYSLNGQTKDALAKSKIGSWKYDILFPGLKINMPDVLAAIGLAQLREYKTHLLPERQRVFRTYQGAFAKKPWAITPAFESETKLSSCHVYPLRIAGIREEQRDRIIVKIGELGIAVNVHFQPLPLLTVFKDMGYNIADCPVAYRLYANEISLPVYPQLTEEQLTQVVGAVTEAVESVL